MPSGGGTQRARRGGLRARSRVGTIPRIQVQEHAVSDPTQAVADHYARGGLLDRLLDALRGAGKDVDRLSIDDLAPIDEFHSRRRIATQELARMLAPQAEQHVIDMGSGLGGPSRYLAHTYRCRVSGVDLTHDFVAVAQDLTQRCGLTGLADFRQGSVLDLPFDDGSFDLAWSQNVAMNIADRPRWYAQIHRVLRPGGRLALQDVALGEAGAPHYPVMWADTPATSFLFPSERTQAMLRDAGFRVLEWVDNTEQAVAEMDAARADTTQRPKGPPPLGIHLIVGPSVREKTRNSERNLREGRTRLINAVLQREP
jgi:SAM-dependent methyltransferase